MEKLIIPISFTISFTVYSLIAIWYLMPALRKLPQNESLIPILFFHSFRYIGLTFLIQGITYEVLDPRFANPAAYGDLAASILAIISIVALKSEWKLAIPLVWLFNIEGTLDLIFAAYQGFRFVPAGHFGSSFFIPAVIVPALLVTHIMVFRLLYSTDEDNPKL